MGCLHLEVQTYFQNMQNSINVIAMFIDNNMHNPFTRFITRTKQGDYFKMVCVGTSTSFNAKFVFIISEYNDVFKTHKIY